MVSFIDDIEALKDCWVVGDEFLISIYSALQELKTDYATNHKPMPYLYEHYNISAWYQSPLLNQIRMARILNSFLDGLNERKKLPKYVLLIPDEDIILGVNYIGYGVMTMIKEQLNWLFKQINKAIRRCRDDLKNTRQGAVSSSFEPRVTWVEMMDKPLPQSIQKHKVLGLRKHFNEALNKAVQHERYMYIMRIHLQTTDKELFTAAGDLMALGKAEYWIEVNRILRLFDRHDIELDAIVPKAETKTTSMSSFTAEHHDHHSHTQGDHRQHTFFNRKY